ncbi:hypothetical protein CERZMDRAFT_112743 [Cercospora zeae-maydis SCOH1-5]|uniref:Secreted protein n=1 Tax=Cercospora zeae-maydis SCOH1-5 TaxID=717836 RepID=A0A6A6FCZ1_9PEZI|nr:hypothetical protein CERZMDRAFT_112743 [Cercospora zeae-maydis SCOH1-5]
MDIMSASTLAATALLLTPVTTLHATSMSTTPVRTLLVLGAQPDAMSEKPKSRKWWKRHRAGSVHSRNTRSMGDFSMDSAAMAGNRASVESRARTFHGSG